MPEGSNYYKVLGVDANSSTLDIKRAYFAAVRKYPPERFPEEFKKIREAYDTLSDPENRLAYDSGQEDGRFADYYGKAREAFDEDNYEEALTHLQEVLEISPGNAMVRNMMGLCFIYMEEYGRAVDIFKDLSRDFPDKSVFHVNLGSALISKGAKKQAAEVLKKAANLDSTNVNAWTELGFCYFSQGNYAGAREALLEGIKNSGGNTSIYMKLIHNDIAQKDMEKLKEDVKKLEELAGKDEELRDNVSWSLAEIAESIMGDMPDFAAKLLEKAKKLNPNEKDIKSLHKDASKMKKLQEPFARMEKDPAIHPWIKDIVKGAVFGCESELEEMDLSVCERLLFREPKNVLSSVKRVQTDYPDIFNGHRKFFRTILENPTGINIDEKKLLDDIRYVDDLAGNPDGSKITNLDEAYIPQMQHINTQKTGRNDPCPCGSGKKYKKCCLIK